MNMNSYNCCNPRALKAQNIQAVVVLYKLLSEENRINILCVLQRGEHCVCELIQHFTLSQSLLSHHLADLREFGLIIDRKDGRKVYYRLTKKGRNIMKSIVSLEKELL